MVLVTHQIQFIKKASKILVLKEGKQFASGTYEEIVSSGIDVFSMIQKPDPDIQNQKKMTERQESVSSNFSKNRTVSVMSTQSEVFFYTSSKCQMMTKIILDKCRRKRRCLPA